MSAVGSTCDQPPPTIWFVASKAPQKGISLQLVDLDSQLHVRADHRDEQKSSCHRTGEDQKIDASPCTQILHSLAPAKSKHGQPGQSAH